MCRMIVVDMTEVDTMITITTLEDAVRLFGSVRAMAAAMDLSTQAIYQWPDVLEQVHKDRVIGAAIRVGKIPAPVIGG